jgi:site-specific DNA recombinase
VPDPSGRKDATGGVALLGKQIEVVPGEAAIVKQIFEWAAEGRGLHSIVDTLNREETTGTRGGRWAKGAVHRILHNERYLGKQIWGQRASERQPGTKKVVQRPVPREQWKILDRPDLRIISDELWARTHVTRAAVREAVAPKKNFARGKDARFHSP